MKARRIPTAREIKRAREIATIEYQKVAEKERDGMARRIIKEMIFILNQEFGFGVKRCARAFKAFTTTLDNAKDNEYYWEHIDQVVIDRMGLPFERDYTDRGRVAPDKPRRGEK